MINQQQKQPESESRFSAVLFDFDYTLVDSSVGAIECINYALTSLGLSTIDDQKIRRTIGLSLPDTFRNLVGTDHADQADEFARLFIKRADQVMATSTIILPDVCPALAVLKKRSFFLGIVSTKFRYRIEDILRRHDLLAAFDIIVGGEDVTQHKPDPEGLLKALHKLGKTPGEVLYVGDSVIDAQTAQAAGVQFIAVLSGVTRREDFTSYPTHRIIDDLSALPVLMIH